MGVVRGMQDVEDWVDAEAESWSSASDREYTALVRRWREAFLPLITAAPSSQGIRAIQTIAERLPADVWVFSGVQVPALANTGGRGAACYRVTGLRSIRRELANRLEL